jgi:signal transduction histidine kinase
MPKKPHSKPIRIIEKTAGESSQRIREVDHFRHRLMTVLANLGLMADRLLAAPTSLPDEVILDLETIKALTMKAQLTISNAARTSPLARGKQLEPRSQDLKIDALCDVLTKTVKCNAALGAVRHLHFNLSLPDEPKSSTGICIDAAFFEEIIENVVDNAVKYSFPNTAVRISCDVVENILRLTVENEGIPITRSEIARIFKRGWRSEIAKRVSSEGSGIGLWLSAEAAKSLGGTLAAEPTSQDGVTRFVLCLPIRSDSKGSK